jgi:hypothetical protein
LSGTIPACFALPRPSLDSHVVVSVWWATGGRDPRRLGGQPEMLEDRFHRGWLDDEGDERHVVSAPRTHERETVIGRSRTSDRHGWRECKRIAGAILAMCFAAPAHPCAMMRASNTAQR